MDSHISLTLLAIGGLIVAALLVKAGLERLRLPPLVGYLLMGLALGPLLDATPAPATARGALELLGELGLVCLLFRVGLEAKPAGLWRQLRRALPIWLLDVTISGGLGFLVARYGLDLALAPSLFAGAALSATSIGVSVAVWQELRTLDTPAGERLLDVAVLDDLSAVILLVVLLYVGPPLAGAPAGAAPPMAAAMAGELGLLGLKLVGFSAACVAAARWVERPTTAFFSRFERSPDPMLTILGFGIVVAAVAGLLGFSVAVGALFAGLVFSTDPEAVRQESAFLPVYDLMTPFFFVAIGATVAPDALGDAALPAALLLASGVIGKVVGGGAALVRRTPRVALITGLSMVPRAEICLFVAHSGHALGPDIVPPALHAGLVAVVAVTTLAAPPVVRVLLVRWSAALTERP